MKETKGYWFYTVKISEKGTTREYGSVTSKEHPIILVRAMNDKDTHAVCTFYSEIDKSTHDAYLEVSTD